MDAGLSVMRGYAWLPNPVPIELVGAFMPKILVVPAPPSPRPPVPPDEFEKVLELDVKVSPLASFLSSAASSGFFSGSLLFENALFVGNGLGCAGLLSLLSDSLFWGFGAKLAKVPPGWLPKTAVGFGLLSVSLLF